MARRHRGSLRFQTARSTTPQDSKDKKGQSTLPRHPMIRPQGQLAKEFVFPAECERLFLAQNEPAKLWRHDRRDSQSRLAMTDHRTTKPPRNYHSPSDESCHAD